MRGYQIRQTGWWWYCHLRGCVCLRAVRDRYTDPNSNERNESETMVFLMPSLQTGWHGLALRTLTSEFHRHANGNLVDARFYLGLKNRV
jgi:hypothetical protein